MNHTIISEDNSILVIDKPAGLRVDKDPKGEPSLEESLHFPVERNGIVHRIDKETSGLVIIAKTQTAYDNIKQQFFNHTIKKIYTTLVLGYTNQRGTIKNYIARDPKRKQAMKVIEYPVGLERGQLRQAITTYKKLADYSYHKENLSLLEVSIETGRTHQIRVHMQSIGHPIIGDQMYFTKTSKSLSQMFNLSRQFLHASQIELTHPTTDDRIKYISKLPQDLQMIIDKLRVL